MFLNKDNKIKWNLVGWGAIVTFALVLLGVVWLDRPLFVLLRGFDCGLFRAFEYIFSAEVWIVLSGILVFAFYVKKSLKIKPQFRNENRKISLKTFVIDFVDKTKNSYAFYIFYSVLTASVITKMLKIIIGRMRPIFFEVFDMTGFYPFTTEWAFNSMPSGHAAATFAGLVTLGMLAPRVKWLTWTLAIIVGISRVAVGVHWVTDVLVGAFVGMVIADLVKAFIKQNTVKMFNH